MISKKKAGLAASALASIVLAPWALQTGGASANVTLTDPCVTAPNLCGGGSTDTFDICAMAPTFPGCPGAPTISTTMVPSFLPSIVPTDLPTIVPTNLPTVVPSGLDVTPLSTSTGTQAPTSTGTPAPTSTSTGTPAPTSTGTPEATSSATPSETATAEPSSSDSPTATEVPVEPVTPPVEVPSEVPGPTETTVPVDLSGGGAGGGLPTGDPVADIHLAGPGAAPATLHGGQVVSVDGDGYAANTDVELTFHSVPVDLGTTKTNSAGHFFTHVTIPAGFSGLHTIVATGLGANGKPLTQVHAVQLAELSFTGVEGVSSSVKLGLALLLTGFAALTGAGFITRRRARTVRA